MRGKSAIVMEFRPSRLLCLLPAASGGTAPERLDAAGHLPQPVSIVDAIPTALHRMGGAAWSDFLDQVSGIDAMRIPARPLLSLGAEMDPALYEKLKALEYVD